MSKHESILELGGEGGGYTIQSTTSHAGRLFRIESSGMQWDPDTNEEVGFIRHGAWHPLLEDVIAELNPRWYLLHPIEVHPQFAQGFWTRYIAACRSFNEKKPSALGQWSEMLLGREVNTSEFAKLVRDAVPRTVSVVKKDHWTPFSKRLQFTLAAMTEDQFLVISLKETNRFVQFAAQGALGMRAEVSSNHFLSGREKLGEKQVRALVRMGWQKPTGTPEEATPEKDPNGSSNFFLDVTNPVDFSAIATLAINTLSEVLGVAHEGFLQYEAFDYAGNQLALPELQIKRGLRDPKLKLAELATQVLNVLREATGLLDLDFNEDGEVRLQADILHPYAIRLVGRPPMVQFFTPVVDGGVGTGKKSLEAVNYLNANAGPVRYAVLEDSLVAVLEVPAWPLQSEHISNSLERFDVAVNAASAWFEGQQSSRLGKLQ